MLADSRHTFFLPSLQHAPLLSYYVLFPNTSLLHFHLVIESMCSLLTGDSQTDMNCGTFNVGTYAQNLSSSPFHICLCLFSGKRYSLAYLFCLQWDHFDRLVIQAVNLSCNKKKKKKNLTPVLFFELSGDDNT